MVAHLDGRFICSKCGHLANPGDGDFQCVCTECFELRSAVERELTANLSGVVRALRQQLLRAHKQMNEVDAAIAALGSSNIIRRSQELSVAGRTIAPRAEVEIGENRSNLNEETVQ
jgi:hypothetical protein